MEDALAEIEFLALSPNRIAVLSLLAEESRSRNDLAAATGASQATLGRILADFEERSWIERSGGTFAATPTGELIADGFDDLLAIVETEAQLRPIIEYLPAEELGFDLARLTDATVTRPTGTRPDAPVKRMVTLVQDADRLRLFSHAFNERGLTAVAGAVADGDVDFQGVFSRAAIGALADDSELRERLRTLLAADNAAVRIVDDRVPLAVTIADDVVHLMLRDADGVLEASIDTDDAAIRDWAIEAFEAHWDGGETLTTADL